jgi:lysophospholipase L1-like esterase
MKPSPSRQSIQPKVVEANRLIRNFLNKRQKGTFIDVYYPMMNPDGTMKKELFLADDLHMNSKGYAIWQKLIAPYLLK